MTETSNVVEYKGYSIEPESDPWAIKYGRSYLFYPTEEGVQHDADYRGESFDYCGNCKWASDMEEAMAEIDELMD